MMYYEDPAIFLTYANTPLENDPAGLFKTLKVIQKAAKKNREELPWLAQANKAINKMVELNSKPMAEIEERINDAIQEIESIHMIGFSQGQPQKIIDANQRIELFSIQNVLGCQTVSFEIPPIFSPKQCPRTEQKFFDSQNLKCYECDQKYFLSILDHLIEGKSFSKLRTLIDKMPPIQDKFEIVREKKGIFGERIKRKKVETDNQGIFHIPFIFGGGSIKEPNSFSFKE